MNKNRDEVFFNMMSSIMKQHKTVPAQKGFIESVKSVTREFEDMEAAQSEGASKLRIANRLKQYRQEKKLSQYDLAQKLGVTIRQITRWENQGNMPSNLAITRMRDLGIV